MPGVFKMSKVKEYPRVHNEKISFQLSLEGVKNCTTIPLAFYDEGKGAPSGYSANPENAAFVETDEANCYPDSRIETVFSRIELTMTKGAIETDKLRTIKIGFMPIFVSFNDALAIDDLSQSEIQDILHLTREVTDKQTYPLWDDTKLTEQFANSALMPVAQAGLTTTQVLENVAFAPEVYYDALQYFTNQGKLKSVQGGLKWLTLHRDQVINIKIKHRAKVRRMVEYGFFGVMIHMPPSGNHNQFGILATDTTAIPHVNVGMFSRYNEWHPKFDMERI